MFGGGLLGTRGQPHRKQRKVLNPVFSIAHMRDMGKPTGFMATVLLPHTDGKFVVPIFYQITHKLEETLTEKVKDGPQEIDMLSWMARTALELVGQAGLGHSFDNLEDEEHAHPYVVTMKNLAPFFSRAFFARNYLVPRLVHVGTPWLRRWISRLLPYVWKDFAEAKVFSDFMWQVSKEIFADKKANRTKGRGMELSGKDVISRLIDENEKLPEEDRLAEDELIGQTALSRILILLATYPDVQKKLREEVDIAFENGDIPYDQLVSLPYLDAIARETLRFTLKDVTLPLSTPVTCTDGSVVHDIFLPRNTDIFVSVYNSNRNKAYWGDDADKWKPERWSSPLPDTLLDAKIPGIYSHLMTFNAGGRSCIGFKFSQLEMKVVLALLVHTFEFSHSGKEIAWLATGVASPVVVGPESKGHPEMPMIVNLVKRDM
ncbi:hypothetical protein V5O48_016380 [Marasmius crinis-equi]|uniref:Cytochrome P450 n=1 Tax=Marasmius crinis-equi TaxID=585013 RepID=A0ABR3ERZ0_9AGAR